MSPKQTAHRRGGTDAARAAPGYSRMPGRRIPRPVAGERSRNETTSPMIGASRCRAWAAAQALRGAISENPSELCREGRHGAEGHSGFAQGMVEDMGGHAAGGRFVRQHQIQAIGRQFDHLVRYARLPAGNLHGLEEAKVVAPQCSKCTMVLANPDRPVLSNFLELKGVPWIPAPQREVLLRQFLDRGRKLRLVRW
jgi:hypothetical protein